MPDVTVNVEVWCAECGEGLCLISGEYRRGGLDVGLCPKCSERMTTNSFNEGYEQGKIDGLKEAIETVESKGDKNE